MRDLWRGIAKRRGEVFISAGRECDDDADADDDDEYTPEKRL